MVGEDAKRSYESHERDHHLDGSLLLGGTPRRDLVDLARREVERHVREVAPRDAHPWGERRKSKALLDRKKGPRGGA